MRKFTYAIFAIATLMSLYCAYNQGAINERKKWQTFSQHVASTTVYLPCNTHVVPPSNIRAKVKSK